LFFRTITFIGESSIFLRGSKMEPVRPRKCGELLLHFLQCRGDGWRRLREELIIHRIRKDVDLF
jgi:hypothetical protein